MQKRAKNFPLSFKDTLVIFIIYLFLRILIFTWRIRVEGAEKVEDLRRRNTSWIFAFWHRELFGLSWQATQDESLLFTSRSRDGEKASRLWGLFGMETVRGSSSGEGNLAMLAALKILKKNNKAVYMTVDGPRGPALKCKPGAIFLSKMAKIPIVPVRMRYDRYWQANNWDKTRLPKPFAKVYVTYCPPFSAIRTNDAEDTVTLLRRLEKMLFPSSEELTKKLESG